VIVYKRDPIDPRDWLEPARRIWRHAYKSVSLAEQLLAREDLARVAKERFGEGEPLRSIVRPARWTWRGEKGDPAAA
jgi:hypothetical protein